jgi:hypothetical protein
MKKCDEMQKPPKGRIGCVFFKHDFSVEAYFPIRSRHSI